MSATTGYKTQNSIRRHSLMLRNYFMLFNVI